MSRENMSLAVTKGTCVELPVTMFQIYPLLFIYLYRVFHNVLQDYKKLL